MKDLIYLDYNATTPVASEVQEAVIDAMSEAWGNVSSNNIYGEQSKRYVSTARTQTASMINAFPEEIVFMSGGTEANHTVFNTFQSMKCGDSLNGEGDNTLKRGKLPHIVTTTIEHPSVRKPLEQMVADGLAEVTFVEVNRASHAVVIEDIMNAIQVNTVLVSLMLANNETGVIQPVRTVAKAIQNRNNRTAQKIYVHTDAAQAIGKIPVSIQDLGVDYLTIVGHKFYGPRIGALYVRGLGSANDSCPLKPMFLGGGQENSYRAGTENTAMIAGLGVACELVSKNILSYENQLRNTRNALETALSLKFQSAVRFNGKSNYSDRLPNTSNISIIGKKFVGQRILDNCHRIIAGVGAACHSNDLSCKGSSVLLASGISPDVAINAIRLSIGRETPIECVPAIVNDISEAVQTLGDRPC